MRCPIEFTFAFGMVYAALVVFVAPAARDFLAPVDQGAGVELLTTPSVVVSVHSAKSSFPGTLNETPIDTRGRGISGVNQKSPFFPI